MKASHDCQAIAKTFTTIEAQNDFSADRQRLHHQIEDLQRSIDEVADPVLKTEYLRRLALLRGND